MGTDEAIKDNAGIMALRCLHIYGCKEVCLAGFDGYSHDAEENYMDNNMSFIVRNAVLEARNMGMISAIKELSKKIKISFLTASKYLNASDGI